MDTLQMVNVVVTEIKFYTAGVNWSQKKFVKEL